MGRMDGKVAFITGVARGQGRSHALRLAEEGAAIVGLDVCGPIPGNADPRPLATPADLDETAKLLADRGVEAVLRQGDVRLSAEIDAVVAAGLEAFGHIDVVVANAGVTLHSTLADTTEEAWRSQLDINLTGAWLTARAAIPAMIDAGRGGSIIFTSSGVALRAAGNLGAYSASKTGLMGLACELAMELAPHWIRVNTLHPAAVNTMMLNNDHSASNFFPDRTFASADERGAAIDELFRPLNILPLGMIEPRAISDSVLFLASDESRMITAQAFRVDAGYCAR